MSITKNTLQYCLMLFIFTILTPTSFAEAVKKTLNSDDPKFLVSGASYLMAGGGTAPMLEAFFKATGYNKAVATKINKAYLGCLYSMKLVKEGKLEKIHKNHRANDNYKKFPGRFKEIKKGISEGLYNGIVFTGYGYEQHIEHKKKYTDYINFFKEADPNIDIVVSMGWMDPVNHNEEIAQEAKTLCRYISKTHNVKFAPIEVAFNRVRIERPDIRLHRSETDTHPSIKGQYLQSCLTYTAITGKSPVGLPAKISSIIDGHTGEALDFTSEIALYLQETAWKVYQNELELMKHPNYGSLTEKLPEPEMDKLKSLKVEKKPSQLVRPTTPHCFSQLIYPTKKERVCLSATVTEYNSNAQAKKISNYRGNQLVGSLERKYKNGKISEEIRRFPRNNTIISVKKFKYKGEVLSAVEIFDKDETLIGHKVYLFKTATDKLPEKFTIYGRDKKQVEAENYYYKKEMLIKHEYLSADSIVMKIFEYSYNSDKKLEEKKEYSRSNKLLFINKYLYNADGTLMEIITNNSKNRLLARKLFKYDEKQRVLSEQKWQYKSGNPKKGKLKMEVLNEYK